MRTLCLLLLVLAAASPALAQTGSIAAYLDAEGTISSGQPQVPENQSGYAEASIYVVLFTEDTAAAAAYSLTIPYGVLVTARESAADGNGLVIDEPTGTNVALAACYYGFGGEPILVDRYDLLIPAGWCGTFEVGPNPSQDPDYPVYVTCTNIIKTCSVGPALFICDEFPTGSQSFGAIKALFDH